MGTHAEREREIETLEFGMNAELRIGDACRERERDRDSRLRAAAAAWAVVAASIKCKNDNYKYTTRCLTLYY